MSQAKNIVEDLESQRLKLEESIANFQKSIYHWRTWEAEYDGLKEEIAELPEDCTHKDIIETASQLGGPVVTKDEIRAFTGEKQGVQRSKQQVEDAVQRRIDYVRENLRVLEKRLESSQHQLDSVIEKQTVTLSKDDDNEGPITDIVEELDDEGNVISSRTKTPEDDAPKILAALKEAGVDKILEERREKRRQGAQKTQQGGGQQSVDEQSREKKGQPKDSTSDMNGGIAGGEKPSNALEEKSKEHDSSSHDATNRSEPQSTNKDDEALQKKLEEKRETPSAGPIQGQPSGSEKEQDKQDVNMPDIDESPEEAALRAEILRYGMEEVGAVVAELELDEDGSEVSLDGDYDDDYYVSEDEEEDEYGRSTRKMITDDYRAQMLELEKRLKSKDVRNIGPDPAVLKAMESKKTNADEMTKVKDVNEAPSAPSAGQNQSLEKKQKKKKKVAFADDLDIAPDAEPQQEAPAAVHEVKQPEVQVLREDIIERSEPKKDATPAAVPPKKVSRFKSARKTQEPIPSTNAVPKVPAIQASAAPSRQPPKVSVPELFPPKQQLPNPSPPKVAATTTSSSNRPRPLMEGTLVERQGSKGKAVAPDDDDAFDENLHRQEIATEFFKMRNRMIAQEGGFSRESIEESETVPLGEDEGEDDEGQPVRKPSRFRAAMMKRA